MKRNIELKAKTRDLKLGRDAAIAAGAKQAQLLIQTDTYFHVSAGRLKLRQIQDARAELIWYSRSNNSAFRSSDYVVSPVEDPPTMLAALSSALGVRGIVKKRRELYLFENVRIHLDEVEGLGTFIEFEAVISDDADERASLARLAKLTETMGISESDRIGVSYSDLAGM